LKGRYFFDSWNLFDFLIVSVSIVGVMTELLATSGDFSNEARIIRINRVFRVLRLMRLFRLFKLLPGIKAKLMKEDLSVQLGENMKAIVMARAFVIAHVHSQHKMTEFFGPPTTSVELARCIMQSNMQIYRCMNLAIAEASQCDAQFLNVVKMLREKSDITTCLTNFVRGAHDAGVFSGREIETITHALEESMHRFNAQMKGTVGGQKTAAVEVASPGHGHGHGGHAPLSSVVPHSEPTTVAISAPGH